MTFDEKMVAINGFFDSFTPDAFCDMFERDFGVSREKEPSRAVQEGFSIVLDVSSNIPCDYDENGPNETYCEAA